MVYECNNNNNFLADVDPDLNYITHSNRNGAYFTLNKLDIEYFEYKNFKNHLSLIHTNIRSSFHENLLI